MPNTAKVIEKSNSPNKSPKSKPFSAKKVPIILAKKPAEIEVKNEIKRDINYDPLAKPTICAISDKTSLIPSTLMPNSSDNDNSFEYLAVTDLSSVFGANVIAHTPVLMPKTSSIDEKFAVQQNDPKKEESNDTIEDDPGPSKAENVHPKYLENVTPTYDPTKFLTKSTIRKLKSTVIAGMVKCKTCNVKINDIFKESHMLKVHGKEYATANDLQANFTEISDSGLTFSLPRPVKPSQLQQSSQVVNKQAPLMIIEVEDQPSSQVQEKGQPPRALPRRPEKADKEKCGLCDFVAEDLEMAQHKKSVHGRIHFKGGNPKYCLQCGILFNSARECVKHKKDEHLKKKKPIIEEPTEKTEAVKGTSEKHDQPKKRSLEESEPISCTKCKFTTKFITNLGRHTMFQHGTDLWAPMDPRRFWFCYHCTCLFLQHSEAVKHFEDKHSEDVYVPCENVSDGCHFRSKDVQLYSKHMQDIHGSWYPTYGWFCSRCKYMLGTPALLSKHVREKHFGRMKDIDVNISNNDLLKCVFERCNFETKSILILGKHTKNAHDFQLGKDLPPKFTCHVCKNIQFELKSDFEDHIRAKHPNGINFKSYCHQCKRLFNSRNELIEHEKVSHRNEFKCSYCGCQVNSKEEFMTHLESLHGLKNDVFQCYACHLEVPSYDDLDIHYKMSHSKTMRFCYSCRTQFGNIDMFNKHDCSKYVDKSVYKCDGCKVNFGTIRDWNNHLPCGPKDQNQERKLEKEITVNEKAIVTTEEAITPYMTKIKPIETKSQKSLANNEDGTQFCKVCQATFLSSNLYDLHLGLCTSIHECTLCDFQVPYDSKAKYRELQEHKAKEHANVTKKCEYCNMAFPSINQIHNNQDHVKACKMKHCCDKCDFRLPAVIKTDTPDGKTSQPMTLLKFGLMRKHKKEKHGCFNYYKCKLCEFEVPLDFDQNKKLIQLNQHIVQKHGVFSIEVPKESESLKCQFCDKMFQKTALVLHQVSYEN